MAPSTPRLSLPTVTPGASAYMPDPEPEREPGWRTPTLAAYLYIACLQGWKVARPQRWVPRGGLSLVPLAG